MSGNLVGHVEPNVSRPELEAQMRKAIAAFRKMVPGLNAYARALTGKKVSVQITNKAGSAGATDGKTIYIWPPIEMGTDRRHVETLCDRRDEFGIQSCPACASRERVMALIYHELAHICFNSFEPVRQSDKIGFLRRAIDEVGTKYADQVKARFDALPLAHRNSYVGISRAINEFLPMIVNVLEDLRVNARMHDVRPGTKTIMFAQKGNIFRNGFKDGDWVPWVERPLNLQAIVGLGLITSDMDYHNWLAPEVEKAIDDDQLRALVAECESKYASAPDVYNISFKVLARLRELGFCKSELDPEDEPEAEEPEDEPQDEEQADEPDESSEDEGGEDAGEPEEGDGLDAPGGPPADPAEDEADTSDASEPEGGEGGEGSEDDDAGDGGQPSSGPGDQEEPSSDEGSDSDDASSDGDPAGRDESSGDLGDGEDEGVEEVSPGGPGEGEPGVDPDGGEIDPVPEPDGPGDEGGEGEGDGSSGDHSADSDDDSAGDESMDAGDMGTGDLEKKDGGSGSVGEEVGEDSGEDRTEGDSDSPPASGSEHEDDLDSSGDADGRPEDGQPEPSEDDGVGDGADDSGADSAGEDEVDGQPQEGGDQGGSSTGSEGDSGEPSEGSADGAPGGHEGGQPGSEPSSDQGAVNPTDGGNDRGDEGYGDSPEPHDNGLEDFAPEDFGTAEEIAELVDEALGHDIADDEQTDELQQIMNKVASQAAHFDRGSAEVSGVEVYTFEDKLGGWGMYSSKEYITLMREHRFTSVNEVLEGNSFAYRKLREQFKVMGLGGDFTTPETIIGPALLGLRKALANNRRARHQKNLKSGKVNARALGKRVFTDDERLFQKKSMPGKRDYFVLIGMDISGSSVGEEIRTEKEAVYAQATLLSRLGIPFEILAHTGNSHRQTIGGQARFQRTMDISVVKSAKDPWNDTTKEALETLVPYGSNLDGHTLEYYRKVLDRQTATDRILMYYTDGAMPSANRAEELVILQQEIAICKQKGYTLMGVGIGTDSPIQHGLDTVVVHGHGDVINVVRHLERRLSAV